MAPPSYSCIPSPIAHELAVIGDHRDQIDTSLTMEIAGKQNGEEAGGEDGGSQPFQVVLKGHWTASEDAKLTELVALHGPRKWSVISEQIPRRSGKSCRLRWVNQLDPAIKKTAFSKEEDTVLMAAHAVFGNKWSHIARFIPGRTDNAIKNHWNVLTATRRARYKRVTRVVSSSAVARYLHHRRHVSAGSTSGSTSSNITVNGKSKLISNEGTSLSCMNALTSNPVRAAANDNDGSNYNKAMAVDGGGDRWCKAKSKTVMPSTTSINATSRVSGGDATVTPSPAMPFIDFLGVGE